jgi:hypothetical protein
VGDDVIFLSMKLKNFAILVVILAALLTLGGCATTEAYVGNSVDPIVEDVPYTHWNTVKNPRQPAWETHHVLVFKNPKLVGVGFDVDCEYNYFHIDVAPQTLQRLLLDPSDGSCDIKRVY